MDIGEVLQRHLFTVNTDDEKGYSILIAYGLPLPLPSPVTAFAKLWKYPCPTGSPVFFTLSHPLTGEEVFLATAL
jgi:hypothetical protein